MKAIIHATDEQLLRELIYHLQAGLPETENIPEKPTKKGMLAKACAKHGIKIEDVSTQYYDRLSSRLLPIIIQYNCSSKKDFDDFIQTLKNGTRIFESMFDNISRIEIDYSN